jgi:hypothetical protein
MGIKMITKEKVKKEIDKMPDDLVQEVYEFISNIITTKTRKGKLHTYKLKGKFDNLDIRESAYE